MRCHLNDVRKLTTTDATSHSKRNKFFSLRFDGFGKKNDGNTSTASVQPTTANDWSRHLGKRYQQSAAARGTWLTRLGWDTSGLIKPRFGSPPGPMFVVSSESAAHHQMRAPRLRLDLPVHALVRHIYTCISNYTIS